MSGIRNLKYAARDRYGGSTNLFGTTTYLSRKPIKIDGPVEYLEDVSIVLNVYFDVVYGNSKAQPVHEELTFDYAKAVELGRSWGQERKLAEVESMEKAYHLIVDQLKHE